MFLRAFLCLALVSTACSGDALDAPSSDLDPLRVPAGGLLVQEGAQLVLWGVTSDNHAIYQDGQKLYSTSLTRDAERELVADLGGNSPFVLTAGKVAFIWTSYAPTPAVVAPVSPLVVWTAAAGPQLASLTSIVATFGVAVSNDSRKVLYIANASADGTIGDLVEAPSDLSWTRTLASGVNVDYNTQGAPTNCRPFLGFAGRGRRAFPVGEYCLPGDSTATLTRWIHGSQRELAAGLALPPLWNADAHGRRFLTTKASTTSANRGSPLLVDRHGAESIIDDVVTSPLLVALDPDGSALDIDITSRKIRRVTRSGPMAIADLGIGSGVTFNIHRGQGGYYADFRFTSPDGELLVYVAAIDPSTGLTNIAVVDLSSPGATPLVVDSSFQSLPANQPYTSDSSHALYYTFDLNTGLGALYAANTSGTRLVSDGQTSAFNNQPGHDSVISFTDHTTINTTNIALSTADIRAVDLDDVVLAPTLVTEQAYLGHFPSHGGRRIVFSSDRDPARTGLFLSRAF